MLSEELVQSGAHGALDTAAWYYEPPRRQSATLSKGWQYPKGALRDAMVECRTIGPGGSQKPMICSASNVRLGDHLGAPQHFLYFLPLPQVQGLFLEILSECAGTTVASA